MKVPTGHISVYEDGWVGLLHPRPAATSPRFPVAAYIEILEVDGEYVAELTVVDNDG